MEVSKKREAWKEMWTTRNEGIFEVYEYLVVDVGFILYTVT